MLNNLGPVISLFKMLIEGLSKGASKINANREKAIHRKVIEIQICLESTIDNAFEILEAIEDCLKNENIINTQIVNHFEKLIYNQQNRIHLLVSILQDDVSREIMQLFTPGLQRNISELVHMKSSLLLKLLYGLRSIKYDKETKKIKFQNALIEWNHDKFMADGHKYKREVGKQLNKNKDVAITDHMSEQRGIVNSLVECSSEMSNFIKSQINLNDVIGLTR